MADKKTNEYPDALPVGTLLSGKFRIDGVLGMGGFGVTYKGFDTEIEREIAIKEYFPRQLAVRANDGMNVRSYKGGLSERYNAGLKKFISEARRTAKFGKNPGVVWVISYFEANGTAYIVMEFVEGKSLSSILEERKTLSEPETLELLKPVIYAVKELHKAHILHRDIAPDNIMIAKDGSTKLIDFGASADTNEEASDNTELVIKPGYAPFEQYDSTRKSQGPPTDVYALCATIYKCISGKVIPEALVRIRNKEPLEKLPEVIECRDIIDKGLAVLPENRIQSVDELIKGLYKDERDPLPFILMCIGAGLIIVGTVIFILARILAGGQTDEIIDQTTTAPIVTSTEATTVTTPATTTPAPEPEYAASFEFEDFREKYAYDIDTENNGYAKINEMNQICIINSENAFRVVDIGLTPLDKETAVLLVQAEVYGSDITLDLLDFYVHYETAGGETGFAEVLPTRSIDIKMENLAFPLKLENGEAIVLGFEVPIDTESVDFVFSGIDINLSESLTGENGDSVIVRTDVKLTELADILEGS